MTRESDSAEQGAGGDKSIWASRSTIRACRSRSRPRCFMERKARNRSWCGTGARRS